MGNGRCGRETWPRDWEMAKIGCRESGVGYIYPMHYTAEMCQEDAALRPRQGSKGSGLRSSICEGFNPGRGRLKQACCRIKCDTNVDTPV